MTPRRRPPTRPVAAGLLVALVLAACTGGSSPSPSPSPVPSPDPGRFALRATTVQALPPLSTFGWLPGLYITGDLRVIAAGAIPAIYPGPLMVPLWERQLSAAGWERLVERARALGLLTGRQDFTGGAIMPGGAAGRLEILVGDRLFDLTGDPNQVPRCGGVRCVDPEPGTPGAFAVFWQDLFDLARWLGDALGPEARFAPSAYAILTGAPPAAEPLSAPPVAWPLSTPLAALGDPVAGERDRTCGIVAGTDADTLRPLLEAATQLTRWQDGTRLWGLTVRPILPGEAAPCSVFGKG